MAATAPHHPLSLSSSLASGREPRLAAYAAAQENAGGFVVVVVEPLVAAIAQLRLKRPSARWAEGH